MHVGRETGSVDDAGYAYHMRKGGSINVSFRNVVLWFSGFESGVRRFDDIKWRWQVTS